MNLVARKVSAYSGDIRRSLQITKRAVEICRDQSEGTNMKVEVKHVLTAFDELYASKNC